MKSRKQEKKKTFLITKNNPLTTNKMETLKKVFTEADVEIGAERVLTAAIYKITETLSGSFYHEMESYLHEFYINAKDKIHEELIKEISDEYISNPADYKFDVLRKKMFLENKDLLVETLTDAAISENVNAVIWRHLGSEYHFSWKWKDAIAAFAVENYAKLKDDDRIKCEMIKRIERSENTIKHLEAIIAEHESNE